MNVDQDNDTITINSRDEDIKSKRKGSTDSNNNLKPEHASDRKSTGSRKENAK